MQSSTNNYDVKAWWIGAPSTAVGGSLSFAGAIDVQFAQDPTGSQLAITAAAGVSGGIAFGHAQ